MRTNSSIVVAVAVVLTACTSLVAADSALDMTGANVATLVNYPEMSSGWEFTAEANLLVTRLGYYVTPTTVKLNYGHVITIYDSDGDAKVSGTVGPGDVTPDVDGYAYVDVSGQNVTLSAGETYVIAAYWTRTGSLWDGDIQYANNYGVATDYITLGSVLLQSSGLGMPTGVPGPGNAFLSASFKFEVAPDDPVAMIEDLVLLVEEIDLQQGIERSLDAKLDAALQALDDLNENNDVSAINKLQAFINEVEAQRDNKISTEQADALVAVAQAIIDLLTP